MSKRRRCDCCNRDCEECFPSDRRYKQLNIYNDFDPVLKRDCLFFTIAEDQYGFDNLGIWTCLNVIDIGNADGDRQGQKINLNNLDVMGWFEPINESASSPNVGGYMRALIVYDKNPNGLGAPLTTDLLSFPNSIAHWEPSGRDRFIVLGDFEYANCGFQWIAGEFTQTVPTYTVPSGVGAAGTSALGINTLATVAAATIETYNYTPANGNYDLAYSNVVGASPGATATTPIGLFNYAMRPGAITIPAVGVDVPTSVAPVLSIQPWNNVVPTYNIECSDLGWPVNEKKN